MLRISIEGNIGSGKTHYLKLLSQDPELVHYKIHYSDTKEHYELTQKYYTDMKRYSLAYHLSLLECTSDPPLPLPLPENKETHVYENSPYTIKKVHCEPQCFDPTEYQIYDSYHRKHNWVPDIMIYLFCPPLMCHERTNNTLMNLSYLTELHAMYEIVCDELNCPIKLFKVNALEDSESVYKNIKAIIIGNQVSTYSPPSSQRSTPVPPCSTSEGNQIPSQL